MWLRRVLCEILRAGVARIDRCAIVQHVQFPMDQHSVANTFSARLAFVGIVQMATLATEYVGG